MQTTTTHSHTTINTLTLDDGTELELEFEPTGYPDPLVTELDNHIVVSYNVYDDYGSTENPFTESGEFEWDDVGRFRYSPHDANDATKEEIKDEWAGYETQRLLDLGQIDSVWDYNEDDLEVSDEIAFQVFSHSPTEYRYAFRSNLETTQPWIELAGVEDFDNVQHILTIPVETMPDMTKAEVDGLVGSMLESYRSWMRGEVYGCATHVYDSHGDMIDDMNHNEAVWGYVGDDHAKESLAYQHNCMVNWLKNKNEEEN